MTTKRFSPRKKVHNAAPAKSASGVGGDLVATTDAPKKRWTILLDIAADGQLANFGIESLKQLRNSVIAGNGAYTTEVIVSAQFSVDAPAGKPIPRYVFERNSPGGSLSNCIADYLQAPKCMTEQQALIDFLQWALKRDELRADYYALILWGHGPELLMQRPPAPGNQGISLYLTPPDLRIALKEVMPLLPKKEKKFDLIAFDACSMSMFEVAYELQDCALYMVASQEEVPDLSFPYDTLVEKFRENGNQLETLLRHGVDYYVQTYQDYLDNTTTDMKPVTLSALRLSKCGNLKNAIHRLCSAFRAAVCNSGLPSLLIKARENAGDFAGGLYVDLYEFATELISAIDAAAPVNQRRSKNLRLDPDHPDCWKCEIRNACFDILEALEEDTLTDGAKSDPNLLVLANCSDDADANGVSLYMPYLSNDQWATLNRPIVKGGDATRGGKDFSSVLNDASPQQLLCERRQLIADTEYYYPALKLARDTGWYQFIQEQWTPILVNVAARDLDVLYSAKQAALNAFRQWPCKGTVPCP